MPADGERVIVILVDSGHACLDNGITGSNEAALSDAEERKYGCYETPGSESCINDLILS
jgi:hypothetical protein